MGAWTEDDGTKFDAATEASSTPRLGRRYTPLFQAENEARYIRRDLIINYQEVNDCRLIVMIDEIRPAGITLFGELLHNTSPDRDLHLLLWSPGGDGEVAIRLARMAQAASRRFVVVVPDIAKSAATILALGAHRLIMGPTSDLGPIDPQVNVPGRGFLGAKDLIAAVDGALADVALRPDTYPLHAAMLAGVDQTIVQFARSALARTEEMTRQALHSNPDRSPEDVSTLFTAINSALIQAPMSHSAVVGPLEARGMQLPVEVLSAESDQWQQIWNIWVRYFALMQAAGTQSIYESEQASQIAS